jgi:hypothetical protein
MVSILEQRITETMLNENSNAGIIVERIGNFTMPIPDSTKTGGDYVADCQ